MNFILCKNKLSLYDGIVTKFTGYLPHITMKKERKKSKVDFLRKFTIQFFRKLYNILEIF